MNAELSISAQIAILALQLGVIIFAARICGELAKKIHVPSVLGELLAGILLGPYLLGSIGLGVHGFEHGLFPLMSGALPVSTPLYAIATLGSIMLLFMSGLETDLRMFFRYSVVGTVVGLGGVIFSFAFGAVLGMVLLHAPLMDPRCLFLGILSTATSVGITARILSEKKSIDSPEGTTILAAAVIDDVLGIICLAVVMGIVGAAGGAAVDWTKIEWIALKSIGIWLGVTAAGLLLAHKIAGILKWFRSPAIFAMLAFGLALLLAGFFEQVGLAMIVGAYVMGLSLSKTDISFSIQRSLRGIYDFLVPVFFVVMGMLVDVRVMGDWSVLKFGLIYSLLAVLAKIIGCALPAFFMNFNLLGSIRIGTGMIPRGEVALIIAGIGATTMMTLNGARVPIIDSRLFGVAIIMTLITTLVAPPLLALMLGMKGKGVRKETQAVANIHTRYEFPSDLMSDFILRILIDNFRKEGFRHSQIDREGGLTHFRREGTTFSLQITGNRFDFESGSSEVVLIRTAVYETMVDLYRAIGRLKAMAAPDSFSSAVLGGTDVSAAPSNGTEFRPDRIIPENCIRLHLSATSQEEAIREMVFLLWKNGLISDPDTCTGDVLAREKAVSTCVSNGVALPHARTDGTGKLIAAVGICPEGYPEFETGGGNRIRVIVLSLCPKSEEKPYLQFIARMASFLSKPENVDALTGCSTTGEVRNLLAR